MPKKIIDKIIKSQRRRDVEDKLQIEEFMRRMFPTRAIEDDTLEMLFRRAVEDELHLKIEEYINVIGARLGSLGQSLTAVGHELRLRIEMFMHAIPLQSYNKKVYDLARIMCESAQADEPVLYMLSPAEKHVAAIVCQIVATTDTVYAAIERFNYFDEKSYFDRIQIDAYYIWEASGKTSGHALNDWLEAEGRARAFHWTDLPAYFEANWADLPGGGEEPPKPAYVRFTVYHPKEIKPEVWCTLLAYVHILEMQPTVEADAKQRLEVPRGCQTAKAIRGIARGAKIVVIPELPGCRFNPTSAHLLWLEDWHRVEFRLQAQPDFADFELKALSGRVAFYVESVLVGEVPFWTCISDEADITAADAPASTASAEPYQVIFVSYAHEDSAVVDRLRRAYKVLGMKSLKDVEELRSGEEWNPALLAMIEQADIFQLYWSCAAKQSRNVEEEWRHALGQSRGHFIRPLYWQLPMPEPPPELARLHFSYLELDD